MINVTKSEYMNSKLEGYRLAFITYTFNEVA